MGGRPGPLRVALADESELVARGLAAMLAPYDEVMLVPPSPGGCLATFVDVTLHDSFARLPVCTASLDRLAHRPAGGRLVVYSWNMHPELIATALRSGASGCLSKLLPAVDLVHGLVHIAAGEPVVRLGPTERSDELGRAQLTPRELEMLGLIASGLTNSEVAQVCGLSINSVKSYIRSGYRKINVQSRSQAVLWAVRNGCVADPTALVGSTARDAIGAVDLAFG
jgi:NarL family two-component system response regulator LiaR